MASYLREQRWAPHHMEHGSPHREPHQNRQPGLPGEALTAHVPNKHHTVSSHSQGCVLALLRVAGARLHNDVLRMRSQPISTALAAHPSAAHSPDPQTARRAWQRRHQCRFPCHGHGAAITVPRHHSMVQCKTGTSILSHPHPAHRLDKSMSTQLNGPRRSSRQVRSMRGIPS